MALGSWHCRAAMGSDVVMQIPVALAGNSSFDRGQRLWAINKAIDRQTAAVSWTSLLAAVLHPAGLPETLGQMRGRQALGEVRERTNLQSAVCHSDHGVVRFSEADGGWRAA
jgi:hypothetical protein